jgi:hypothetical protein
VPAALWSGRQRWEGEAHKQRNGHRYRRARQYCNTIATRWIDVLGGERVQLRITKTIFPKITKTGSRQRSERFVGLCGNAGQVIEAFRKVNFRFRAAEMQCPSFLCPEPVLANGSFFIGSLNKERNTSAGLPSQSGGPT